MRAYQGQTDMAIKKSLTGGLQQVCRQVKQVVYLAGKWIRKRSMTVMCLPVFVC